MLVESAADNIEHFDSKLGAHIVATAIVLGGSTLGMFHTITQRVEVDTMNKLLHQAPKALNTCYGYDNRYSRWLVKNMHIFDNHPLRYLTKLGMKSEIHVRMSHATVFDDESQATRFNAAVDEATSTLSGRARTTFIDGVELLSYTSRRVTPSEWFNFLAFCYKNRIG